MRVREPKYSYILICLFFGVFIALFSFRLQGTCSAAVTEDFDPADMVDSKPIVMYAKDVDMSNIGWYPDSVFKNYLLGMKNSSANLENELWRERIAAPIEKDDKSKIELQDMIKRLSTIEIRQKIREQKPAIVLESKTESAKNSASLPANSQNESKAGAGQMTEKTLQMFKDLSQHPEQLHNPYELAELLFNCHCLPEAAKCYKETLNRMAGDKTDRFQDKAWLLFQTGNCLQRDDPQTAMQMYKRLISECPDSQWTEIAKAKSKLIDWYLNDKPKALIGRNNSQGTMTGTERLSSEQK